MSGLDTGIQGDRSVACPWTLGSSPRVTVCGLLLAARVATAAPAPVLAQDRQVGLVKVVEGEAFALRADGRSALGVGQPIYVEDVVETEAGSLVRSEEHTSELQPLMRTSYAVFCLKQK